MNFYPAWTGAPAHNALEAPPQQLGIYKSASETALRKKTKILSGTLWKSGIISCSGAAELPQAGLENIEGSAGFSVVPERAVLKTIGTPVLPAISSVFEPKATHMHVTIAQARCANKTDLFRKLLGGLVMSLCYWED